MNIYIPKHLRKLGIVEDLCNLIKGYQEEHNKDTNSKFDADYHFNKYKALSYDPVKKFVGICIITSDNSGSTYDANFNDDKINYITEIFYSLSGSYKIFDMLVKLLGLKIEVDYQINLGYLKIELITSEKDTYKSLFGLNEELFYNSFSEFLNTLLFFKKVDIIYKKHELKIKKTDEVFTKISDPILYSVFDLT